MSSLDDVTVTSGYNYTAAVNVNTAVAVHKLEHSMGVKQPGSKHLFASIMRP